MIDRVLDPDDLELQLFAEGRARYHDRHPFHRLLIGGHLDRGQVQAWALNRFCYQAAIPRKDAMIVARAPDPALRRVWRQRLVDHDGSDEHPGGFEKWLRLTDGLGLDRELVVSTRAVLPGVRFATSAYLRFVEERPLLEGIASSLTELFAPRTIVERVAGMLRHYDFVTADALAYFETRLTEAPRDADFALGWVKREARTLNQQRAVLAALIFKCDVLWAQLDALHHAYVAPAHLPMDAFRPEVVRPDARRAAHPTIPVPFEVPGARSSSPGVTS